MTPQRILIQLRAWPVAGWYLILVDAMGLEQTLQGPHETLEECCQVAIKHYKIQGMLTFELAQLRE